MDADAVLNGLNLSGARYRPVVFEPTFDKHAGTQCGGCFVHVLNRLAYEPVPSGIAVLREVRRLYPDEFAWRPPPFEYDAVHMPIDILSGTDWVRKAIDNFAPLDEVRDRLAAEVVAFAPMRDAAMLYRR